ncbi:helix-turn-helix transcriptional regulator [Streptomyces sp. NPDC006134]|uniref:helix-turn-helix domain-containing protein n=1 Tax=Streptomyces sp. NPDC006134 TaxID=3154467 RepID=UPI003411A3E6
MGAYSGVAELGQQRAQVGHREFPAAAHVDPAQQRRVRRRHPPTIERGRAAPGAGRRAGTLTEAELEVARPVARGMTDQQVARHIARSPHAVNHHLRQIFRKPDVGSRVEPARRFHEARDT